MIPARSSRWLTRGVLATVSAVALILTFAAVPASAQLELDVGVESVTEDTDPATPGATVRYTVEGNNFGPGSVSSGLAFMNVYLPFGVDFLVGGGETVEGSETVSFGEIAGLFIGGNCDKILYQVAPGQWPANQTLTFEYDVTLALEPFGQPGLAVSSDSLDERIIRYAPQSCDQCFNDQSEYDPVCWGGAPPISTVQIAAPVEVGVDFGGSTEGCGNFDGFTTGNIALIDRGTCTFDTKAQNAQNAGASAAIIANNGCIGDGTNCGHPDAILGGVAGADNSTVTIPTIMISQAEGDAIKAAIDAGETVQGALGLLGPESADGWELYTEAEAFLSSGGSLPVSDPEPSNDAVVEMTQVMAGPTGPEASFTFSPSDPEVGEEVSFTDTSTGGPTSWIWDFGDGMGTSNNQNPTYTYEAAGEYQVSLTVVDDEGAEDTTTMMVTVTGVAPTASFIFTPDMPGVGQRVRFSDLSTGGPTSWSWDFGDGGTAMSQNPSHQYTQAGTFTVTLVVANEFGSDSASQEVTVTSDSVPSVALPAVASIQGAGAFFTSKITALNAGDGPLSVEVTYTPRADQGGASVQTATMELAAGQMMTVSDPLGAWFTDASVGSLLFTVTSGDASDFAVQSTVFASNDDGTQYGQFFPAIPIAEAVGAGGQQVVHSTVDGSRSRVNFGVMALEDGTEIWAVPQDPVGTDLGTPWTTTLDMGGNTQINNVANEFGLAAPAEDFVMAWGVTSGSAVAYVSVVDGVGGEPFPGTNDPTTILAPAVDSMITLLELGPVQGINEFSGSAQITNASMEEVTVDAAFHARGQAGISAGATITLQPGETMGYTDMVGEVFGTTGVGTVVLDAGSGLIAATGREFSLFRDSGGEISGTAGQLMAGLTADDWSTPGEMHYLIGLQEGGGERSHIAVFNPGADDATITTTMYDAGGNMGLSTSFTVRGGELVQVNNILDVIDPNQDGTPKRVVVDTDQSVLMKAFRVNASGDPITIDPFAH